MAVRVTFETHATTTDNEAGRATGWLPGELSAEGRLQARSLGLRHVASPPALVVTSDLARAVETVSLAFADSAVTVLLDWRLRECNYGRLNGAPREQVLARRQDYLIEPYPEGECWQQAVERVGWLLRDLSRRWDGAHVLLVGHVATQWGLEHHLKGRPLEDLAGEEFVWQEGWEYVI
jgi:2,3-bisphosphoglycerate-dependent phosphoglycerate mutase